MVVSRTSPIANLNHKVFRICLNTNRHRKNNSDIPPAFDYITIKGYSRRKRAHADPDIAWACRRQVRSAYRPNAPGETKPLSVLVGSFRPTDTALMFSTRKPYFNSLTRFLVQIYFRKAVEVVDLGLRLLRRGLRRVLLLLPRNLAPGPIRRH